MLPRQLRVGDLVDDYCPRERRLSNHAIVALVGDEVRLVRCTTCDTEHEYRGGKLPVTRKRAGVTLPPLPPARSLAAEARVPEPEPRAGESAPAAAAPGEPAAQAPPEAVPAPSPHAEYSLHRPLIRATLPRVEGDVPPPRPIPEFTMHRPAPGAQRRGKPFRHGQGGGRPRPAGKGGPNPGRPGGPRPGQGEVDGNSVNYRGGQGQYFGPFGGRGGARGSQPAQGPRGAQGHPPSRGPRHGFGGKPPRGPKKH